MISGSLRKNIGLLPEGDGLMMKICKLVFRNIYIRYFPVNYLSIQQIGDKDLNQISIWVKSAYMDIEKANLNELGKAHRKARQGYKHVKYRVIKWIGDDPIVLYNKLNKRKFSELSDTDIKTINDVIYFHKYKSFISIFVPVRKGYCNADNN